MTAANTDTELLTEHFGYPPVSLLDEIINSINVIAERALASVEQGLLNAPPQYLGFGEPQNPAANTKSKRKGKQKQPPPEDAHLDLSPEAIEKRAHDEISSGTHQLETLLCASIDRNFDKFELYVMRNILCVKPDDRDWLRLGHYGGLNFDNLPTESPGKESSGAGADSMDVDTPDRPTVESVNRLRRRLQASQRLNTMLHAEKARNDALLGELRSLVGRVGAGAAKDEAQGGTKPPFAFLQNRGDLTLADANTPLTTTTAFSLSQLQALRALSTSLSSILPNLQGGGGDEGGARRTWRKERVEYVEGAARKHLENVRGLELGRDGEVRDGEWQGEGRRFAGDEVVALEGIANALGSGGGGDEKMDE
ncbi:putative mis12 domain-containing protein [Diaporthe ampelina]|uniref:Putative mis12 domain-containing protein n=1 Tax=Diaporthe ampelina TaxID=1214573 RepID=A0A0G2FZ80_9PEZI|nr:putative mis12 domain-containing protein [Diaporthe ampelina]